MTARKPPAAVGELPAAAALCDRCGGNGAEVWPCPLCKQPLHIECGRGVAYARADWPPQQVDGQPVTGAWHCTECGTVAGLDVDEGGDAS